MLKKYFFASEPFAGYGGRIWISEGWALPRVDQGGVFTGNQVGNFLKDVSIWTGFDRRESTGVVSFEVMPEIFEAVRTILTNHFGFEDVGYQAVVDFAE